MSNTPITDAAMLYCGQHINRNETTKTDPYLEWYGYMCGVCRDLEEKLAKANGDSGKTDIYFYRAYFYEIEEKTYFTGTLSVMDKGKNPPDVLKDLIKDLENDPRSKGNRISIESFNRL